MRQILQQEKDRLIIDLNENMEKIQALAINQDIETGAVDSNLNILEAWKIAYITAKQIDQLDYWFDATERFLFIIYMIIAIYSMIVIPIHTCKRPYHEQIGLVMAAITLDAFLMSGLTILNLSRFNFNKNKLNKSFENMLINNFSIQRPTGLYPFMLTPTIINNFKRNKHLFVGFPGDFSNEKKKIANRAFWAKLNPWHDVNPLPEDGRLYTAYEYFHAGKPIATFNNLIDIFANKYFQFIADSIMSQTLLLLSPKLIGYSTETQKRFYQLMGHCARLEPDSPEFIYASFKLQFFDSETMPFDWIINTESTQKGQELCRLGQNERQAIVKMLVNIFNITEPSPKKMPMKINYCFFSCNKMYSNILDDEHEKLPLLKLR